ncbi:hypothetical protein CABS01_13253 [Colletotrichum abscissum]|uniref:uncharacterized protein n=1 Tax=Colletotrichum abscissum TaxID=1671311 RepID=UPI0027D6826A|nr:uncharacterized protein CABS01_13253 [Colletotrichum abscissum]KAK1486625.1 hypothetical protein CABS01_13253 [Colletotrichum abscissum]
MSVSRPQLSLWEKRDLVFRLLFRAPIQLAWNFLYGIPFAIARGVSIRFFAFCAYYRFALGSMRAREIQFLIPPSIKTYAKWIAKKQKRHPELADKLQKKIESLPANDGSILWIGNRQKATKFVLFFHGGGYVVPLLPGHLDWCWNAYVTGGPGAHAEVAVAILQYTLVPEARYPTQLRQAIAAFNQLILSGIKPNDLLIGGDSAGGNLACSVVRHICHPCHLEIPALRLENRLAGVFLVSPWLSSKTTTPAFTENNYVDMLTTTCMSRATAELLHPRFPVRNKSDESDLAMAMPMDGDMAWVDEISAATKSLYITGGQQEAFRDDIRAFSEHVSCGNNDLDLLVELPEREAHDFILLEAVAIVGEMPPDQPPLNCAYNRDDVVAGLTQYYSALTRLAYIPSSYVDFPPPGGWTDADLDIGALRALRRSEVVIDLLRHLPYARPMHDGPRPGPWNVAPQTKAVRYLRHMGHFSQWSDRGDAGLHELAALPTRDTGAAPMDLPPDVVCLTYGEYRSSSSRTKPYWWIIDCSRGILTPYEENLYTVGKVPRNKPWRCVRSYSVTDYFSQLVSSLGVQLFPVPPTEDDDAEILDPSALAKSSEPVDIYSAHGWGTGDLADFKHDECIVALQGWRRRVHEAEQRKIAQDVDDADDEDFEMDDSDDDEDAAHEGEAGDGLADAVADMEMDDLSAEAAALRADMSPEERAKFDCRQTQSHFEWIDEE